MEYLGIYHLSKIESKNLIDYSRNMCQSDQGIMISTYWNGVREKTLLCGCPINGKYPISQPTQKTRSKLTKLMPD